MIGLYTCLDTSTSCSTLYQLSSYTDSTVTYLTSGDNGSSYSDTHSNDNSSTLKTTLDNFYVDNLLGTEYESYLKDVVYCSDRSLYYGTGVGTVSTQYYDYYRLYLSKSPSLECSNINDAFTVSDSKYGNEDLTYMIGTITADEVALAGGLYGTNNTNYYLYIGSSYWTMSPSRYYSNYARTMSVSTNGSITETTVHSSYGVRPVINISEDVVVESGNGTYSSPYILTLS